MVDYVCVGKIINTFGIKGELKIISDFEYKERIFKQGKMIYIGNEKIKEVVNTHRIHKNYDLIIFAGYSNINEVLKYKGDKIYINRCDLELSDSEYLLSDLIGYKIIDQEKEIGLVIDYEKTINNVLLKIKWEKPYYIPLYSNYVINIDKNKKEIITNNGSDLII